MDRYETYLGVVSQKLTAACCVINNKQGIFMPNQVVPRKLISSFYEGVKWVFLIGFFKKEGGFPVG